MKILVTGGAGFIGSHITDTFIAAGHAVVVLDDLSTGKRQNVNPQARLVQMDIRDPQVDALFAAEQFEGVVHQAARANVRESMEKPLLYADVNILGSLNLLEASRKHGVKKFLYASTGGAAYGEPKQLPVPETHAVNPLDPYGASKHHVEHYLFLYRANYGLSYTVLRYPNVYGPRQDPHGEAGVVAIFTARMLKGEPVVINGDGTQERDFCFVGDVARANLLALSQGDGEIFNIGTGRGTNINEIFDHLSELTHYPQPRSHGPRKLGEVFQIYLDPSKAKRGLGWQAEVSLADGLKRTVDFFRP
ncbi:MAG: NAD-dependent epimerase/dehydratase family protein [Chloroflexi bacterium]|nr:NAD-dependent epimerase/dehydratase family protein [Chloroflexota bacterium]